LRTNRIQQKSAAVLRKIGSKACIEKARMLESSASPMTSFNFRSLGLSTSAILSIAGILRQEKDSQSITSISFSYNRLLGDSGAIALAQSLPDSICEVGLVDCRIGEKGGIALLDWIKEAPNLKMICIEQNHFSDALRMAFREVGKEKPNVLVVF